MFICRGVKYLSTVRTSFSTISYNYGINKTLCRLFSVTASSKITSFQDSLKGDAYWKQYFLSGEGEEIESSLTQIQNEWRSSGSENQEIEFGFLCISKHYDSAILSQVSSYIKEKLKIRNIVGGVVDGIWNPAIGIPPKDEAPLKAQGMFLILGGNILASSQSGEQLKVTSFHQNSPQLYKLLNNSVGRWRTNETKASKDNIAEPNLNGNDFDPEKFSSISQTTNTIEIPKELNGLKDDIRGMFFIVADRECLKYLEKLDKEFPTATKFGIIAASTPFINGKDVTIYQSSEVHSEGIVGIYVGPVRKPSVEITYPSLNSLGGDLKISRCKGNIILELEGYNATQQLLNLVKSSAEKLSKETEFYVRLNSQNRYIDVSNKISISLYFKLTRNNLQKDQIIRVGSGDPSKGTMSLETTFDLYTGDKLQFLYRPASSNPIAFLKNRVNVCCASDNCKISSKDSGPSILSENGFIIGDSTRATRVVDLKDAFASLSTS